ncbi:MAG: hypothetical protein VKN33_06535 [Candidatus Sericytochromatia bacterium]|nr:hypothetical protein [Candidatus Sericytochromatia bacterium]
MSAHPLTLRDDLRRKAPQRILSHVCPSAQSPERSLIGSEKRVALVTTP